MFFDLSLTPETDWDRISCLEGLKYQSLSHGRLNEGKLDGDLKTWFEKVGSIPRMRPGSEGNTNCRRA